MHGCPLRKTIIVFKCGMCGRRLRMFWMHMGQLTRPSRGIAVWALRSKGLRNTMTTLSSGKVQWVTFAERRRQDAEEVVLYGFKWGGRKRKRKAEKKRVRNLNEKKKNRVGGEEDLLRDLVSPWARHPNQPERCRMWKSLPGSLQTSWSFEQNEDGSIEGRVDHLRSVRLEQNCLCHLLQPTLGERLHSADSVEEADAAPEYFNSGVRSAASSLNADRLI